MLVLGLNEAIDQSDMVNSIHWYDHVLMREGGHVMRRALHLEVEGQRKKGRPKKTWRKQAEEESVNAGLRREDALCQSRCESGYHHLLG